MLSKLTFRTLSSLALLVVSATLATADKLDEATSRLPMAIHNGDTELVRRLLKDLGPHRPIYEDDLTLAHMAALQGQLEILTLILKADPKIYDMKARNKVTPLYQATGGGNYDCVLLLLERGANVNGSTNNGFTPLHLASAKGDLMIARLLLDKGANIAAQDIEGFTPLHEAVRRGNLQLVYLFLDHKADVNAADRKKLTPLHYAAKRGYINIAGLLLKQGANVNAKAEGGLTPLALALQRGERNKAQIANLLRSYGGI